MRLLLDIDGDRQLERTLLRMADRVDDMSDAFEQVGDHLATAEQRQFASQGGYASGGWKELAESTVARKGHDRILVDSGDLRASLEARSAGGDAIRVYEPSFLIFGSAVEYARFHQLGQGVPQRRPVELTEGDRREAVRILQRAVVEGDR